MKIAASLFLFMNCFGVACAQSQLVQKLSDSGDSAYLQKNYGLAIDYYGAAAKIVTPVFARASFYYNIACCYGLQKNNAGAWNYLDSAAKYGYSDYVHMTEDGDLNALHTDKKRWGQVEKKAKQAKAALMNPQAAKLVTEDIHHFWEAYDAVQKDTSHAVDIYNRLYFGKATPGLRDYFSSRIYSAEAFVANQKRKKQFYPAIRNNTLQVDAFKKQMRASFVKFKTIYPDALFPNVYFVIGRWTSAGTVSSNGLLIGTDMLSKSEQVPLAELNLWERNNYKSIENLPYIVAHELIHYEQGKMAHDTTTLSACIREGMADFIGELISGKNSNPRLHEFAKGKEKTIWAEFERDMYLNRPDNWIANSSQERPDHPADLGYWIGYQVCKAYYETLNDPKKAVYDMLHIKDYRQFLQQSRYAEKLQQLQ
ncbi:MAG: DUF2268 domain-containing putative Zn-dependent protease [Ferruginibacter sp.]